MKVGFYFRENQTDPALEGTVYGYVVAEIGEGKKTKSCGFSTKIKVLYKDYLNGAHAAKARKVEIEVEALYTYLCGALDATPTAEQVKDEYLRRKKPIKKQNIPKPKSPLIADILAEYVAKSTIRQSSRGIYESLSRSILAVLGKDCLTEDLTEERIRHLYNQLSKPETNARATQAIILLRMSFKKCKLEHLALKHFEGDKYRQKGLVFLEKYELESIWRERELLTGTARTVADYFCFMCETGISICDLQKMNDKNVIRHEDGMLYLIASRKKTSKEFYVEITERAQTIGEAYKWQFPLPCCQLTFRIYVTQLMQRLGIDKNITPHKARHTKAMQILDDTGDTMFAAATLGNSIKMIESHYGKLRINGYARIAAKYRKK